MGDLHPRTLNSGKEDQLSLWKIRAYTYWTTKVVIIEMSPLAMMTKTTCRVLKTFLLLFKSFRSISVKDGTLESSYGSKNGASSELVRDILLWVGTGSWSWSRTEYWRWIIF